MNHWERQGTDGTNENPHNFLIYSLGRGGIFQPILIILCKSDRTPCVWKTVGGYSTN